MPVYEYKALDAKGRERSGLMDAETVAAARLRLKEQRLYPTRIDEARSANGKNRMGLSRFLTRIPPKQLALATRQLSTLLGAGFPLVNALGSIATQIPNPALKRVLSQVKDSVENGSGFADALEEEKLFTPIYVNLVRSGESSGSLEIVMERLADLMENQQQLKSRIRGAMLYPMFMLLFGLGVVFLLLTLVVPGIVSIFSDLSQTLPLPTRILLSTSDVARTWWWLILLAILAIPAIFRLLREHPRTGYQTDRMILGVPVIGELVRRIATARFSRTLGSLLDNGVSILKAMAIVKNVVGNRVLEKRVQTATLAIEHGESLASGMKADIGFPDMAIQMIQVGEQSGTLEPMLIKVADIYEKESESTISTLTSLLEPIIILVMGILVGMVVLAICLPIFEMNQLIH